MAPRRASSRVEAQASGTTIRMPLDVPDEVRNRVLADGHAAWLDGLPSILASLALSAIALIARLLARQGLTQVLSGAVLALISAAWAWRSGQASNFYATGLLINAVWLVVTAGSILVRRPLVGLLIGLWHSTRTGPDHRPQRPTAGEQRRHTLVAGSAQGRRRSPADHQPQRPTAGEQRRHTLATAVLAGMFALRLVVEVPLYLAGASALGALGVARLVLGVPLYLVCVWLAWLIARPRPQRERR